LGWGLPALRRKTRELAGTRVVDVCTHLPRPLVLFCRLPFDDVWLMFGEGVHPKFPELLERELGLFLSQGALNFWACGASTSGMAPSRAGIQGRGQGRPWHDLGGRGQHWGAYRERVRGKHESCPWGSSEAENPLAVFQGIAFQCAPVGLPQCRAARSALATSYFPACTPLVLQAAEEVLLQEWDLLPR